MAFSFSRRKALLIAGAATGFALIPGGGPSRLRSWTWRGSALGAKAQITLIHPDKNVARRLVRMAVQEIERLESIFSLYRPSELTRLNQHGKLDAPSFDLVTVLSTAQHIGEISNGAFDVTVQPLWQTFADHFGQENADLAGPSEQAIETARRLVDYRFLEVGSRQIHFAEPNMAVTLNGIAQGYITDRVAELLSDNGIERLLLDLGEVRAIGAKSDKVPWMVAYQNQSGAHAIELTDKAIATSSPKGTQFRDDPTLHHLFDPATGRPSRLAKPMSVMANSAMIADALSTALALMAGHDQRRLVHSFAGAEIV